MARTTCFRRSSSVQERLSMLPLGGPATSNWKRRRRLGAVGSEDGIEAAARPGAGEGGEWPPDLGTELAKACTLGARSDTAPKTKSLGREMAAARLFLSSIFSILHAKISTNRQFPRGRPDDAPPRVPDNSPAGMVLQSCREPPGDPNRLALIALGRMCCHADAARAASGAAVTIGSRVAGSCAGRPDAERNDTRRCVPLAGRISVPSPTDAEISHHDPFERRPVPPGHVRYEAGSPQRVSRRVQAHPDQRTGNGDLRADAVAGEDRG